MIPEPHAPSALRRVVARRAARPALAMALRQMIAFIVPFGLGVFLDQGLVGLTVGFGAMASGMPAFFGSYRARVTAIVITTAAIDVVWVLGTVAASPVWLAGTVAFLLIFVGAYVVVLGMPAAMIGGIATMFTTVVMGFATPLSVHEALVGALHYTVGGVFALFLVTVAMPFERAHPQRLAVIDACRSLGTAAAAVLGGNRDEEHAARVAFLSSYNLARATLLQERRAHMAASRSWSRDAAVLAMLPRIEDRLLALRLQLLDDAGDEVRPAAGSAVRDALVGISDSVSDGRWRPAHALESLSAAHAGTAAGRALRELVIVLARLESLATGHRTGDVSAGVESMASPAPRRSYWETLTGNLHWSSIALRHATRVAVLATAALVLIRVADYRYAFWVPMTIVIVMIPDYGGTVVRGLQRAAGTLAGGVISILLIVWAPPSWVSVCIVGVCMFAATALIQFNYGLAVSFITGTVLIGMAAEGSVSTGLAETRVIFTLIGAVLAIVAVGYLWPLWGRTTLRSSVAELLDAAAALASASCSDLAGEQRVDAGAARRRAELALANVEASEQRILTDPKTRRGSLVAPFDTVLAAQDVIDSSVAVEASIRADPSRPCPGAAPLGTLVDRSLTTAARAVRDGSALPLPPDLQPALRDAVAGSPNGSAALNALVLDTTNCVTGVQRWQSGTAGGEGD